MHNVLIVDEEEHLLIALEQNLFPERDDIKILTATNGEEGLEHLKESRIDLLISDIKMPGKIDGFQLILRAKEVAPDARVIIITAFGINRVQNFADRIGITHYIEKPFNTAELRDAILEILDEKEGFQGVLSDLELTDIIQMLCLAKRTALLHLKHRDHRGRIVFDNGELTHAEFDDVVGVDAVYSMLALRQGDIFMQSDFKNDRQTIEMGWQDLLFEGIRLADEQRAEAGDLDEEESEPESEDDVGAPRSGTDVGIAQLEEMVQGGPDIDDDGEPDASSFFSEDELREIELAGLEDSEGVALPFASLAEDSSDSLVDGRIGVANGAPRTEDDGFRSPFQRERSAMVTGPPKTVWDEVEPDPATQVVELDLVTLPLEGIQAQLERFARECPGLRQTAILSGADGMALNSVSVVKGFDPEAMAALIEDIVRCAQRTVDALGPDELSELQVAVGDKYVLLRAVEGSPYHHLAVVDRHVSLGVALVMMRRFQKTLQAALEDE